ncbi:MAG: hypothetical protein AAB723_02515, partial [Patescibacteria group bacterium]
MGKFNFNQSNFEKIKVEAEELYKTLGEVYCPYFLTKIVFNAKGLRHLKFKSDQQARPQKDQYPRLKLLHLAPEVLKKSSTLQGIKKEQRLETRKINSRWEKISKYVTYYEF